MLSLPSGLPHSKQLYHLGIDGGVCDLVAPHAELQTVVDYYWFLQITAPRCDLHVIPDTAIDLVLCTELADFAAIYLPVSQGFSIPLEGPIRYAGVCFRPAAIEALLGTDVASLRHLQVGTHTIDRLGINELVATVQGVGEISELKDQFDSFWTGRQSHPNRTTPDRHTLTPSQLIDVLEESLGDQGIASVSRTLNLSERQFRRVSRELYGLSPKKIQNVLRLQRALNELFHCQPHQLDDLYFDDSHRIRELKALTGLTPQQIMRMAEKYNS